MESHVHSSQSGVIQILIIILFIVLPLFMLFVKPQSSKQPLDLDIDKQIKYQELKAKYIKLQTQNELLIQTCNNICKVVADKQLAKETKILTDNFKSNKDDAIHL